MAGAGGCGREVMSMLIDSEKIRGKRYNIKGFLDDTKSTVEDLNCPIPVAGSIQDFYPKPNDAVILGIAAPEGKRKVVSLLKGRGVVFESFIHPYVALGNYNRVGEGVVIYGGFGMTVNVTLGNFTTLQACYLGHDVTVGDFSTISSYCNIMGHVTIGQGVFMGSTVAIVPKTTIGDNAFLCVGSVILEAVPPGAKMLGNPARQIG